MQENIKILGIESSCDETAAAIVDGDKNILAHNILSQINEHKKFGGVVPEVAARAHLESIDDIIIKTLKDANMNLIDVDAIAAACGPGLIGGVIVGAVFAKSMAAAMNKPFIAINHLEAHALTPRITEKVEFPYLVLLTSGGHCQILIAKGLSDFEVLGGTIDDAAGEAFDKTAKMLGLPYPGGPEIEKLALLGNPKAFKFPRPLKNQKNLNFSFSGLKTAVRIAVEKQGCLNESIKADICASFQAAVCDSIEAKITKAALLFKQKYPQGKHLAVVGGVAANKALRAVLENIAIKNNLLFAAPPVKLCTDNGAMIAWAGLEYFNAGITHSLDFKAKPRWPLG